MKTKVHYGQPYKMAKSAGGNMPRNPKLYIRNSCIEITFRTEEGLPLVATPFLRVMYLSILANAQTKYPITICHYIVMANHIHLLLVVDHPHLVPSFVRHLKCELSHAINGFLGRRKRTVWCAGYDSPQILDLEKAIDRIVYFYTNPQRANLVDRIDEYPNCTSWEAFLSGGEEQHLRHIPRTAVEELPEGTISLSKQDEIAESLIAQGQHEIRLFVDPDAWVRCFIKDPSELQLKEIKERIIKRIRQEEESLRAKRQYTVVGALALRLACMRTSYHPKKHGKKMICLGTCVELRRKYIKWFQSLREQARSYYQSWKLGALLFQPPPGMFSPGGAMLANLNPYFAIR